MLVILKTLDCTYSSLRPVAEFIDPDFIPPVMDLKIRQQATLVGPKSYGSATLLDRSTFDVAPLDLDRLKQGTVHPDTDQVE